MSAKNALTGFLRSPGRAILGLCLAAFAVQELNHQAISSASASSPGPAISAVEPVRTAPPAPQSAIPVRGALKTAQNVQMLASSRFLLVEQMRGRVTYGPSQQPVKAGQQLRQGTQVSTGSDSSARLLIDGQIGSVEVAENTTFQVKTLTSGKTSLFVTAGRVRLSVSPGARLPEAQKSLSGGGGQSVRAQSSSSRDYPITVETPAGIAGVQGTSFGVNVGPKGKTCIATLQGTVAAQSQGREVLVNPGQYVVIEPGKAPMQPQMAPKLAAFRLLNLKRVSAGAVRAVGQAHPLDLVSVNGRAVPTDADGKFSVIVEQPLNRRIKFVVRGPAATETVYDIAVL